ncbi:heavy metal-associated isoprenylated plant protein 5-like isoform X1 [Iris pallida]|uniref:Heavy metal-associated isoprenylated plant protein 5-like isoform X1 n=1 Tax=Iris pallida TaxID=29817 RepID=A0AAX6HXP1_IRIPA|nr:heavy metal-associated isoprenylated plant protein 5-like isoform X1 [Iris pallida]
MATDMEKARVTELHVRMDCNGCVQRIKKAMLSIDGVYDVYVDLPQQKITVVGRVEPEVLVKAIKKTKKTATVCSHTDAPASTEPAADQVPGPAEAPPAEAAAPPPEAEPSPQEPKDVEEVHMVHLYPHSYGYREHWNPTGHGTRQPDPQYCVNHSYSRHMPPPHVSEYVTEHGHRSPPRDHMRYHGSGAYGDDQITTIFSDENPNACSIV